MESFNFDTSTGENWAPSINFAESFKLGLENDSIFGKGM